ncbi:carbohydrate-binding family 9-like protein [Lutimonas sp.]|uniref:carbohydrate-binding family 9-like protein n=1 Tax=Lutimonas sp. TaxID=1872403 RepID=UPI003D9ACA76
MKPKRTNQQEQATKVPKLHLQKENFTQLGSTNFYHSVGGKAISELTLVSLRFDDIFLEIKFECLDNPRMDQNYYTQNNQPLFEQEVFEIFISQGSAAKETYWEIQLNPNNALFVAQVRNNFKTDQRFHLTMIDNEKAQIEHHVVKDKGNNSWKGHLKIPLKLIEDQKEKEKNVYRMNLFRIISNKDQDDPKWQNNAENATFACWNSPMTETPNFHKPEAFGILFTQK